MADSIVSPTQEMQDVALSIVGFDLNWDLARDLAYRLAAQDNEDPMLVSWFDASTGKFSPSCCKCQIQDGAAWEVYGKNHGGRYRISVNDDTYVFIYT